ncbi:MAG: PIG-L family deacetylase [bacterium]
MSPKELTLSELGPFGRVVVVAPHPDDEVFAVGGLMASLAAAGYPLDVVAVTDGEASHAQSTRITPDQIRCVREQETLRAYQHLQISPRRIRLAIPDSGVARHLQCLADRLLSPLLGASFVVAPIETDGHPDHDATSRAVSTAADALGIPCWQYAVWAWLNPERLPQTPAATLPLNAEIASRKRRAARSYTSQLNALGPDPVDGPVLPANFLEHFDAESEFLWQRN